MNSTTYLVITLSLLLLFCALALRRARDLFAVVVLMSVYSTVLAISFAALGAVDVSFTEAVVGSSISTILLILLLRRVNTYELVWRSWPHRVLAAGVTFGVGVVLVYGALALPPFGDPQSPPAVHVSQYYLKNAMHDMKTPNVVTAVLADYRGFDTLIETVVVLTAALGCMLVMGVRDRGGGE